MKKAFGIKVSILALQLSLISFITVSLPSSEFQLLRKIQTNQLEKIKNAGVLRVLTQLGYSTFNKTTDGYSGLEYDLVKLFADHLNVKIHFIIQETENFDDISNQIASGSADIAAAGISITKKRKKMVRFSPPYDTVSEQIVYHSMRRRPQNISDISNGIFEVVRGTSYIDTLMTLKSTTPELQWNVNPRLATNSLIFLVNEGLIDYTVANSNQIGMLRRFYPRVRVAFNISRPRNLGWVLAKTEDTSLYNEINHFFRLIKENNTLEQVLERYYGHIDKLDNISLRIFREHMQKRLPKYQNYFEHAALKYKIDWRLLAAIGYQESHWNKQAISPTGVRGIMMLTNSTADEVGVKDRTDPEQSINGGALYFQQKVNSVASRVKEPDRIWMALASYNIGSGHLEDARMLTKKLGHNPDKWIDVKMHLPLLSKEQWNKQTRYGYAQGNVPVHYVDKIRNYYELLVWMTEEDWIGKNAMLSEPEDSSIILTENDFSLF